MSMHDLLVSRKPARRGGQSCCDDRALMPKPSLCPPSPRRRRPGRPEFEALLKERHYIGGLVHESATEEGGGRGLHRQSKEHRGSRSLALDIHVRHADHGACCQGSWLVTSGGQQGRARKEKGKKTIPPLPPSRDPREMGERERPDPMMTLLRPCDQTGQSSLDARRLGSPGDSCDTTLVSTTASWSSRHHEHTRTSTHTRTTPKALRWPVPPPPPLQARLEGGRSRTLGLFGPARPGAMPGQKTRPEPEGGSSEWAVFGPKKATARRGRSGFNWLAGFPAGACVVYVAQKRIIAGPFFF